MRAKMSREDRAKQFMPFAALRGYEDALRAKERIVVDKKELGDGGYYIVTMNEVMIDFRDFTNN